MSAACSWLRRRRTRPRTSCRECGADPQSGRGGAALQPAPVQRFGVVLDRRRGFRYRGPRAGAGAAAARANPRVAALASQLHSNHLDRARPLWEYCIIDGVDVTVNSVFAAPMTSSVALLGPSAASIAFENGRSRQSRSRLRGPPGRDRLVNVLSE